VVRVVLDLLGAENSFDPGHEIRGLSGELRGSILEVR
jgi:hypothetical protein